MYGLMGCVDRRLRCHLYLRSSWHLKQERYSGWAWRKFLISRRLKLYNRWSMRRTFSGLPVVGVSRSEYFACRKKSADSHTRHRNVLRPVHFNVNSILKRNRNQFAQEPRPRRHFIARPMEKTWDDDDFQQQTDIYRLVPTPIILYYDCTTTGRTWIVLYLTRCAESRWSNWRTRGELKELFFRRLLVQHTLLLQPT